MAIDASLGAGIALRITPRPASEGGYATSSLQKGLTLAYAGADLAEEAVGFGVPVLMRGLHTIFPGGVTLAAGGDEDEQTITADYRLNLVERVRRRDGSALRGEALYGAKNALAALIRRSPASRRALTAVSSGLRAAFGWRTTYEDAGYSTTATLTYVVRRRLGSVHVEIDTAALAGEGVTEVVVMNEQGGHHFDRYEDSSGACLTGARIGCWDLVTADEASFASRRHGLAFSLGQAEGARLYRGREVVGSRLAWAGFGYSLPPGVGRFGYALTIAKVP